MIGPAAMQYRPVAAADATAVAPGPTPLYATPRHVRRLRVLCVTPEQVPAWLDQWRALAADERVHGRFGSNWRKPPRPELLVLP